MADVPEQGRLTEHPLPRLLLDLHRAGFGGSLTLSRDHVGKRFLFRNGVPVFAESNLASESLGVQLMDARTIDRADYNRVVAYIDEHGCKEGKALLALNLLEPKELFLALKEQVRLRIVECFGWPHGEFYADPTAAPSADTQPFSADLYALLQEGLETHWSGDRVLADLAPQMERYPRRQRSFPAVAERLRCDSAVEALLEALDGTRTFWKAMQAANTPRSLAAAWVLDASAALDYRDEPCSSGDAAAHFERDVELVVGGAAPSPAAATADPSSKAPKLRSRRQQAAVEKLRREIDERHQNLKQLDHYALLGVQPTASAEQIKAAYRKAAKTYHPDALARSGLDAETREQANDVFAAIGKAHAVVSDSRRRGDYDAVQRTSSSDLDADRLAQAEVNYRKAEVLLRLGNFRGAHEFLRSAVDFWPDECAYQSGLGWALYKKSPSEPEAALEHLEKAARLDPDDGITQFRLSVVLRQRGDDEGAAQAARRAEQLGGT
jgi:curved DNA-binding protein CbpA